jgi:pimeloyl-ACP methyl ester carboxylesterase
VHVYQEAIALWPASHCALEYHRWLFRSRLRADGRRFNALMRPPVTAPVLCVDGDQDPVVSAPRVEKSRAHVSGAFTSRVVPGAGHFPHEEQPQEFNGLLLSWLDATR